METPVGAPFNEKLRLEIAKLREMTLKKKMEYIWDYYKPFIIGVVIALLLLFVLLNTWMFNPSPEIGLLVSWSAGFATDEQITDLKTMIERQLFNENENKEIQIPRILTNTEDPSITMMNHQRVIAMVSAGTIDVFVLDSVLLEVYSESGFLYPMEGMLAQIKSSNPEVYEIIAENITFSRYELDDGSIVERIVGISLNESPLFSETGIIGQDLYYSVSVTSRNKGSALQALLILYT